MLIWELASSSKDREGSPQVLKGVLAVNTLLRETLFEGHEAMWTAGRQPHRASFDGIEYPPSERDNS